MSRCILKVSYSYINIFITHNSNLFSKYFEQNVHYIDRTLAEILPIWRKIKTNVSITFNNMTRVFKHYFRFEILLIRCKTISNQSIFQNNVRPIGSSNFIKINILINLINVYYNVALWRIYFKCHPFSYIVNIRHRKRPNLQKNVNFNETGVKYSQKTRYLYRKSAKVH